MTRSSLILKSCSLALVATSAFAANHESRTTNYEPPSLISAGRRVTDWIVGSDGTWRAQVRSFGPFSQLYVNGQLRQRPYLPRKGYWKITREVTNRESRTTNQKFALAPGQIDNSWKDLDTIEVCVFQYWTMERTHIVSYDPPTQTVTVNVPAGRDCRPYSTNQWFRLDNVRAAFGEPGDWYLEKSGELLYRPMPGETPQNVEVVAAVSEQALELNGMHDITFRGVTFAYAGYRVPETGCVSAQAAVDAPAAVRLTNCRNVHFVDCAFVSVGGYALEFGAGCSDCSVTESIFDGMGAGGVRIGTKDKKDPTQWATRCSVENCLLQQGGRFDPAGVGILVLNANHCRVAHNTVRDFYYSGISCGWMWDRIPSGAFANVIEANDISNIGQGVMTDLGGIYMLGAQPGTIVRKNVIRGIHSHNFNGIGLYLDQGCAFMTVEDNYVDDCTDGTFFIQYNTASNRVSRNVLCRGGSAQLWHSGSFPERTHPTLFCDNMIWWDDPSKPLANRFFHPRFIASTNNVASSHESRAVSRELQTAPGVTFRPIPRPEPPKDGFGCPRRPRLARNLPPPVSVYPTAPTPVAQAAFKRAAK